MKNNNYKYLLNLGMLLLLMAPLSALGQWVALGKVNIGSSNEKGMHSTIKYNVGSKVVFNENPVYIFVRYRSAKDGEWKLLSEDSAKGDGLGIIEKSGQKTIHVPFSNNLVAENVGKAEFQVRGISVREIPEGEFNMLSVPGANYHEKLMEAGSKTLPKFYMTTYETTISMYTDFLNESDKDIDGWNDNMANETTCGILREGSHPNFSYKVVKGRENYPVTSATWFSAKAFLIWCGLLLPTEAEWEKATIGGTYLDGDNRKKKSNPMPDRNYPWGNEDFETGDVIRANIDGDDDGYEFTAPIGSFPIDKSPYGIYDLAGNVAEWTLDFYTNRFLGDNGYRVLRGGSWLAFPEGVDAVSQATSQPLQGSPMIGFRGVKGESVNP